jgi:hypothetical protein
VPDEEALDDAQIDFSQTDDSLLGTQAVVDLEAILEHGTDAEKHRA